MNMSYIIETWRVALNRERASLVESTLKTIDPTAALVLHYAEGNQVRMWLERANDGRQYLPSVQELNRRMVDLVNLAFGTGAK